MSLKKNSPWKTPYFSLVKKKPQYNLSTKVYLSDSLKILKK